MSKSKWRANYDHLVSLVEGVVPQSKPHVRFKNARGKRTKGLEDLTGRDHARHFRLYVDEPSQDDGSTGVARRRVKKVMALDILYPRTEEGELLMGEDETFVEATLRLNPGRPATSIVLVRPMEDSEIVEVGEDGPTGGLILRLKFDVIYVEDNTP